MGSDILLQDCHLVLGEDRIRCDHCESLRDRLGDDAPIKGSIMMIRQDADRVELVNGY